MYYYNDLHLCSKHHKHLYILNFDIKHNITLNMVNYANKKTSIAINLIKKQEILINISAQINLNSRNKTSQMQHISLVRELSTIQYQQMLLPLHASFTTLVACFWLIMERRWDSTMITNHFAHKYISLCSYCRWSRPLFSFRGDAMITKAEYIKRTHFLSNCAQRSWQIFTSAPL